MSDVSTIIERIGAEGIRTVDFRFTDLVGRWRHVGRDAGGVDAELLDEGMFIDGSSIPGWRDVTEADLVLRPDLASGFVDPFSAQPTLVVYLRRHGARNGARLRARPALGGATGRGLSAWLPLRRRGQNCSRDRFQPVRRGEGRAGADAGALPAHVQRASRRGRSSRRPSGRTGCGVLGTAAFRPDGRYPGGDHLRHGRAWACPG